MSHFSRVRTQLRNLDTVETALKDLGYQVERGNVRGFGGQQARADLVVRTASGYDIGFVREGEAVTLVADFWGVPLDRDKFLQKLTQRYAYLTVLEQAQAQGWQVAAEEVEQDGSIRLVMQRWSYPAASGF